MNRWNIDSQGSETIPHNTVAVGICLCKFVQTHRMYSTKREPSRELWTLCDNDVSVPRFTD